MNNKRTGRAAGLATVAGAAATAIATAIAMTLALPAHADVQFVPTIGVTETWTDNYFLVRSNLPREDQLVTRANAELLLLQQNERLRTRLKYNLDAILNGPESGAKFHDGRLESGAEVLRDWFFVDLVGAYSQYSVDPLIRRNPDHIFPDDTLTDVGSGSVTGALRHDFDFVHLDASYSIGAVRFERRSDAQATPLEDSGYENVSVGLTSLGEDALLYWSAGYAQQRVDYDNDFEVAHDLASLDLALRVAPSLRLLAHGGLESDPREFDAEGGLDESSWMAGFAWRYRRGELRLMAGEGVFGNTYDGSFTASGRIVNIDIGYQEATTTQTEEFLPFLATDSAGNLITVGGQAVLTGLDDPFSRLAPDVFHQERLRGRVALTGRLTDIELALRSERRSYLLSGVNDRVRGANLTVSRALGSRSRAELNGRYDTVTVQGGEKANDSAYSLTFYRLLGQRLQLTASASRAKVSSSSNPFVANWIAVGLQMSFGRTAAGTPPGPRTMGIPTQNR